MANESGDHRKLASVFTVWWRELQSLDKDTGNQIRIGQGQAIKAPDRKALAELRRIGVVEGSGSTVIDVGSAIGIPAFRQLIGRSNGLTFRDGSRVRRWLDDRTLEPFAIAACALARVREDAGGEQRCGATAFLLGQGDPDPVFAEARFKRLIRSPKNDWPDLMAQARRISAILERKAPVGDFGASIVLWNAEPRIIRDWAFRYYQRDFEAADAAPKASPPAI